MAPIRRLAETAEYSETTGLYSAYRAAAEETSTDWSTVEVQQLMQSPYGRWVLRQLEETVARSISHTYTSGDYIARFFLEVAKRTLTHGWPV
jgi:hypothetical protein